MVVPTNEAEPAMQPLPPPPKILPPHWFLLVLITMLVLGWFAPDDPVPVWMQLAAIPLILAGVGLAGAGSRLFARAGTNIVPLTRSTTLVTSGVFSWSRNPMYLGMMLTLSGVALLVKTWLAWLVLISFVVLIRQRFVLKEEALLLQTFGEPYAAYMGRVRRWL
jgi:protein-S-isoprenylcysteine O-methyltransferase Ste14